MQLLGSKPSAIAGRWLLTLITSNSPSVMAETKTTCPECNDEFDPRENPASKKAATVAGAGTGAVVGSSLGIAGGLFGVVSGGIAGTVPGVVVGATGGKLIDRTVVKCPHCGEIEFV